MAFTQAIWGVNCDQSVCSSSSVARIFDSLVPFPNPYNWSEEKRPTTRSISRANVYRARAGEEAGGGGQSSPSPPLFVEKI